jgi:hypothetical protein
MYKESIDNASCGCKSGCSLPRCRHRAHVNGSDKVFRAKDPQATISHLMLYLQVIDYK